MKTFRQVSGGQAGGLRCRLQRDDDYSNVRLLLVDVCACLFGSRISESLKRLLVAGSFASLYSGVLFWLRSASFGFTVK